MRYFSLLAVAATLLIANGCASQAPRAEGGVACPNCGKVHAARQDSTRFTAHGQAMNNLGWRLVSAGTAEVPNNTGDYGPAQVFQVQGPADQAIQIGRVWPTCSCIEVVSGTGTYPAGTPAQIVLRQVKAPPAGGVDLNVQILQPKSMVLTASIPVKQ